MRNVMLAVLMTAMVAAAQIPTDGLLARYDFTGGALTDGSGNGRNLAPNGNMPALVADRDLFPNNAFQFEGTLSAALEGQDEGLPTGSTDRSVCFWVALAEKDDSVQQVLTWGSLSTGRDTTNSFRLVFRRDTLCIQERGVRLAKYKVTNADFPATGTFTEPWVNVALVLKADTARWYINGLLKATIPLGTSLNTAVAANTMFYVGAAGGGRKILAKIDEVLIYNRALTTTEVRGIYDPIVSVSKTRTLNTLHTAKTTVGSFRLNGRSMSQTESTTRIYVGRALTIR